MWRWLLLGGWHCLLGTIRVAGLGLQRGRGHLQEGVMGRSSRSRQSACAQSVDTGKVKAGIGNWVRYNDSRISQGLPDRGCTQRVEGVVPLGVQRRTAAPAAAAGRAPGAEAEVAPGTARTGLTEPRRPAVEPMRLPPAGAPQQSEPPPPPPGGPVRQ